MNTPGSHTHDRGDWTEVDRGWGHQAVDFATLSEPSNCREYVAVHHRLGVDRRDRLLDIACGAGLAIELARARGATCWGIDASHRLVAIARDRNPDSDVRVGDMHALPWDDATFDVVTSFRGIWATTPDTLGEALRVLVPGGRIGITVWGYIKKSPGAWALAPFSMAAEPKVSNQAAMVALGRPGVGEELLDRYGFENIERTTIPYAMEFSDPKRSNGIRTDSVTLTGDTTWHQLAVDVNANETVTIWLIADRFTALSGVDVAFDGVT
ncbi:MAG: class I SAM-dependent methyltransferase [Acidimicrobiia bacterium]